ncbi:MAG: (deoxy)nucleoside triphosphate pyrophosphohydrolase [Bacteroidia bacterium]|nr:(deoxy)nucleoside triphosphate pyrophosphohydrolase [Bacteroidia bacterium]
MIRVTCAIIRNEENEVLVVQRGEATDHPLKWEFPGGKVKEGETEEECIIREIREELSIDIVICSHQSDVEYDYGKNHILLIPFVCDTLDEMPVLSEHVAYKWIRHSDLKNVDFSEADMIIAENYLHTVEYDGREIQYTQDSEPDSKVDEDFQSMIAKLMGMKEAEWIASSAVDNPAIFKKLLEYSFSDDKNLAFRASWTLTKVCDQYPAMIYPNLPEIVEALQKLNNESVQRSFLRIISLSDISQISIKHHGLLADHCFSALKSGFSAIAIKAYSMEILYKLALIYPELANELAITINMLQAEGSAGIIARGRIILKRIAEIRKT